MQMATAWAEILMQMMLRCICQNSSTAATLWLLVHHVLCMARLSFACAVHMHYTPVAQARCVAACGAKAYLVIDPPRC